MVSSFKKLKTCILYGEEIEGGGVEKNAATIQRYRNDIDLLVPKGKHTIRQNIRTKEYNPDREFTDLLDEYDIIFVAKIRKNGTLTQHKCLYNSIKNTKAKTGLIIHEARTEAFGKFPLSYMYVNICDAVFTFSETTQLTKDIKEFCNTPVFSFQNPFDYSEWENDCKSFKDRLRKVVYFGRFATYKQPEKLSLLYNKCLEKNKKFTFAMHGIDRSIGSKTAIIDLDETTYHKSFDGTYPEDKIDVFGTYLAKDASKFMGNILFGYNGFQFENMRHNYVYRLEYAQMEIIGAKCIPIFNKRFGESVFDKYGKNMCEYPYLALWFDPIENNSEEILKQMEEIESSEDLYNKYIESGKKWLEENANVKECVDNLFICMDKVTKKNINDQNEKEFINNIYGTDAYDDFTELYNSYIPFVCSYDFRANQLRYIDENNKIKTFKKYTKLKKVKINKDRSDEW